MKVYIVKYKDIECNAFLSKELAEKKIKELLDKFGESKAKTYWIRSMELEEITENPTK